MTSISVFAVSVSIDILLIRGQRVVHCLRLLSVMFADLHGRRVLHYIFLQRSLIYGRGKVHAAVCMRLHIFDHPCDHARTIVIGAAIGSGYEIQTDIDFICDRHGRSIVIRVLVVDLVD